MHKEITSGIDLVKTGELLKQKILNIHMEELLVTRGAEQAGSTTELLPFERRMLAYWKRVNAA